MILFFIAFISGVLTILAPCVLPLLPVILGRSLTDTTPSRRRLFVVVISLGASIILFTLLLKASSLLINIPQDFWKWISGGIIFLFGLTMVFPKLWDKVSFANTVNVESNKIMTKGYLKNSIWGDVIIGASLGPIFSACSPTYFVILATVLPVSFFLGMIYLVTYVAGLIIALVIVALVGERVMAKLGKVSDPRGWFKKTFGIIFILVAVGIISGYDKKLQIHILDSGFLDVTKIEQKLLDHQEESMTEVQKDSVVPKKKSLLPKSARFMQAPDISTPDGFINTDGKPITLSEFKGKKVVLLDIWTYSCINCQRTLPYLNQWNKEYEDDGLVIIGLHTPEFAFEKIQKNVEQAVREFGIEYPVVLDNDFSTWNAYGNRYWPRKYLIDIDGYVVYDHAGEGQYAETEMAIQEALQERAERLGMDVVVTATPVRPSNVIAVESGKVKSPETYFGSARNSFLANGTAGRSGFQQLTLPTMFTDNRLYLGGEWNINPEYAENTTDASIVFPYEAKNVYMAAGSDGGAIEIFQDGVFVKSVMIKDEKLYPLIQNDSYGKHQLMIKIPKKGLKAFTFTFG